MSRVTVLTPTLNSADHIGEALESLRAQNFPDVEHIVLDGGSSDRTVELVQASGSARVIGGRDRGIYDALNKGMAEARGSVVGFLNSDDRLPPQTLARVMALFEANHDLDVVTGFAIAFGNQSGGMLARYDDPACLSVSVRNAMLEVPVINARYFRRSFLERVGPFSLDYPLAADREYLIRAAILEPDQMILPAVVYEYRAHAGSKTLDPMQRRACQLAEENMTMAEAILREWTIDHQVESYLRQWHTEYSLTGMFSALRRRDFGDGLRHMVRGWRHDGSWAVSAPRAIIRKIRRRMS